MIFKILLGLSQLATFGVLYFIITQIKRIMTETEKMNAFLESLDEATTEMAGEWEAILLSVKNGTVTDEQFQRGDALVSKLKAIGTDPANPIPAEEAQA